MRRGVFTHAGEYSCDMYFKRVRSEGLAHLSYFLESEGQAAVIDPRRDVGEYLDLARAREARIMIVLETHRNEDYVSGALELANATGAEVQLIYRSQMGYWEIWPTEDIARPDDPTDPFYRARRLLAERARAAASTQAGREGDE